MNIPELGVLTTHDDIEEWLISKPVPVPYFDGRPMTFTLDGLEESDEPAVATAVASFLSLTAADRDSASASVYQNYLALAAAVDEDEVGCSISSPGDVWNHVTPHEVFVKQDYYGDKSIYVRINAECDWEPEHGLQIIYRHGRDLSRVSAQDGHLTD